MEFTDRPEPSGSFRALKNDRSLTASVSRPPIPLASSPESFLHFALIEVLEKRCFPELERRFQVLEWCFLVPERCFLVPERCFLLDFLCGPFCVCLNGGFECRELLHVWLESGVSFCNYLILV